MKLFRNALAAGLLAGATVLACSSHHGSNGSATSNTNGNGVGSNTGNVGQEGTGSVGMHLTIGPGLNLYALNWSITNGTNSYSGSVQIGDAQSIEFVAGGILAGGGYTVTLTGTDSAGDFCQGVSATFSVAASATSFAGVVITCTQDTDATTPANVNTGSVHVDAGVNVVAQGARTCPGISSFSISPAEILATGQTAQLNVATIGPAPTSIQWTVSGGAGGGFSNPNAANPTFSCGGAGLVTITVQVLENGTHPDGTDAGNVCNGVANTSFSGTINCEATGGCGTCFSPTTLQCGNCLDGGATSTCVNPNTDNNNCGGCGIVCTSPNSCQSGLCKPPPPVPCTGGVAPSNTPAGCVPCDGNTNGVCNSTEQIIANRDIAKGNTTSSNTFTATSCYECLVTARCIDAQTTSKTGNDCEDLSGTVGAGAQASETKLQACLNTLGCELPASTAASCGNAPSSNVAPAANDGVSNCYCGLNYPTASSCSAASGTSTPPVNGACETFEVDGLGLTQSTSGTTVLANYTVKTTGSGMANAILKCAGTNTGTPACPQCFQ
jgi:hypothetical protein